jgi:hypothetical protein
LLESSSDVSSTLDGSTTLATPAHATVPTQPYHTFSNRILALSCSSIRTASKAITELADANTVLACCLAHPPHLAFKPLARVPTACIGSHDSRVSSRGICV